MMQDWKDGKEPKKGPQNGRINSCGIEGRTSLYGESTGPIDRDFEGIKQEYEAAKAASAAAAAAAKVAAAAPKWTIWTK